MIPLLFSLVQFLDLAPRLLFEGTAKKYFYCSVLSVKNAEY